MILEAAISWKMLLDQKMRPGQLEVEAEPEGAQGDLQNQEDHRNQSLKLHGLCMST